MGSYGVPGSIVTTSIRFDTVRNQILEEAIATEASYSQVQPRILPGFLLSQDV